MKDYRDVAESVFRKSEIILEAKAKRMHKIRNVSIAASGMCAAAIVAVGVIKNNQINSSMGKSQIDSMVSNSVIDETQASEPVSTEAVQTTAIEETTKKPKKTKTTAAVTTEAVETKTTAERIQAPPPAISPSRPSEATSSPSVKPQQQASPSVEEKTEPPVVQQDKTAVVTAPPVVTEKPETTVTARATTPVKTTSTSKTTKTTAKTVTTTKKTQVTTSRKTTVSPTLPPKTSKPITTTTSVEWTKLPIQLRFEKFDVIEGSLDNPSRVTTYHTCDTVISKNKIQSLLVSGFFHTQDPFTGEEEKHGASAYIIKDVDRYDQLAVKFDGDDDYYLYENRGDKEEIKTDLKPMTIENMIDDLHLREKMVVTGEAVIHDKKEKTVHGIEAPFVWQILTNEAKLPNIISEVNDIDVYVEFKVQIAPSSNEYMIGVSKDGYVYTDIVANGAVFNIGQEQADDIIDAVLKK